MKAAILLTLLLAGCLGEDNDFAVRVTKDRIDYAQRMCGPHKGLEAILSLRTYNYQNDNTHMEYEKAQCKDDTEIAGRRKVLNEEGK